MPRVRRGAARARKHRKVLKSVRGHIGAASRRYHVALEAQLRAGQYATIGRKLKKRDFRRLWITRISAACRQRGLTYSRFMHALSEKGVAVNRKMLAEIAVADPVAFDRLAAVASGQVPAEAPAPAEDIAAVKAAEPKKTKKGTARPKEPAAGETVAKTTKKTAKKATEKPAPKAKGRTAKKKATSSPSSRRRSAKKTEAEKESES